MYTSNFNVCRHQYVASLESGNSLNLLLKCILIYKTRVHLSDETETVLVVSESSLSNLLLSEQSTTVGNSKTELPAKLSL